VPEHKCFACEELTIHSCILCNKFYCEAHTSELDPDYCNDCLTNTASIAVKESKPLVDDEGVKHEGRMLVPIGKLYFTSIESIVKMTDEELMRFIAQYTRKIHEAEHLRDYYSIMKNAAELETHERGEAKARERRATGFRHISTESGKATSLGGAKSAKANGAANAKMSPADIVEAFKKLGMNAEQFAALAAKARGMKKPGENT